MPPFMFHLLEYMDVDYEIDVEAGNRRWAQASSVDAWSKLVITQAADEVALVEDAPRTGIWTLDEATGRVGFPRCSNDRHGLDDETEPFSLRALGPGDCCYRGANRGVVVTRWRLQDDHDRLTERARAWTEGIRGEFCGTSPRAAEERPCHDAPAFKPW
jgi:hypothetical protein